MDYKIINEKLIELKKLLNQDLNNTCYLCSSNFTLKKNVNKHLNLKRCKSESIDYRLIQENLIQLDKLKIECSSTELEQVEHQHVIEVKVNIKQKKCYFCNQYFDSKIELQYHYENNECNCDFLNDHYKINQMLIKLHKYEYRKYKMPSGKFVNYQGYENFALDELIMHYNENDIENYRFKVPVIKYNFKHKEHMYYPDIFIKSENKIIEVKSEYTYKFNLVVNILKALSAKKQGFKFEFWIYKIRNNNIIESKIVI